MDAGRLMGIVEDACARSATRWVVVGGIAMNAYGHARGTVDFDIAADEAGRSLLLSALSELGFETLNDIEGFTNLRHPDGALGRLDIMWLDGTTADSVFSSARRVPGSGGIDVPVPRAEHLVAMKVRAIQSSPTRVFRDGADLQHLLALPELDHNEARGYFERAGLLDLWERLRTRG